MFLLYDKFSKVFGYYSLFDIILYKLYYINQIKKKMEKQEYSVSVLKEKNGGATSDQRWCGPSLETALVIAAYEYGKEIIQIELKEKNIKRKPDSWHKVNMDYAPKVQCRIIVVKEIDPRIEASGKLPKIMKSYGNKSIKQFQRIHFDN